MNQLNEMFIFPFFIVIRLRKEGVFLDIIFGNSNY